jgi:hypothetical protein
LDTTTAFTTTNLNGKDSGTSGVMSGVVFLKAPAGVDGRSKGGIPFGITHQTLSKPFSNLHRHADPFVCHQMPHPPAATHGEQPEPPLARLAAVAEEGEHRPGVGRGEPVGLGHLASPRAAGAVPL